jgi:hypothetical protein
MSTQTIRVVVPAPAASPRGARWAAALVVWLSRVGRSIWRALETAGQRRAARELRALAAWHEPFDPELARRLREASRFDTTV